MSLPMIHEALAVDFRQHMELRIHFLIHQMMGLYLSQWKVTSNSLYFKRSLHWFFEDPFQSIVWKVQHWVHLSICASADSSTASPKSPSIRVSRVRSIARIMSEKCWVSPRWRKISEAVMPMIIPASYVMLSWEYSRSLIRTRNWVSSSSCSSVKVGIGRVSVTIPCQLCLYIAVVDRMYLTIGGNNDWFGRKWLEIRAVTRQVVVSFFFPQILSCCRGSLHFGRCPELAYEVWKLKEDEDRLGGSKANIHPSNWLLPLPKGERARLMPRGKMNALIEIPR